ncbi:protein-histidine kinase [Gigaspora margarita]|uniref:Protein-histidine kinase n=1 Tax=Gigaspora margarita TaxID=4874 RepID=A0A8H4AYF6_GIGMA|nr:protein-histidine kinase [Gigaspora margarita]
MNLLLGLDKGADDYLVKPFSSRELITRIRANIELSLLRRKILFQLCKQEEVKQLLFSITLFGSNINESFLDVAKEIHRRLPCERILIVSNNESKSNKIVTLYEDFESITQNITLNTSPLTEIGNNKSKSQTFTKLKECSNNKPGIDLYSDVYCDNVHKIVSILSVEIRLNNDVWGWIKVHRSPNSIWLESEIELLQQISNQTSLAITCANLLKENTAKEIQLKTAEIANNTISQILANTSHELRTPLNALVGLLSLFEGTNLNTDQKDMLSIISHASDVILLIVNDILDVAKLEAQKLTLANRTFDLLELIEGTIETFGKKASDKKIELILNCDIDILPRYVKSDPERLKQVLSHLLSNAVKFTKKGEIMLTVSMQSREVFDKNEENSICGQMVIKENLLIELRDTGIGIDPEYIQHVWKSFSQGDTSIIKNQDGTGIGLSICKSLVELNGGEIKVKSQLEKGSKFWFTWNVELLSKKFSLETQFNVLSYALRQKRILIIHPIEDVRNAMLKYLKKFEKVDAFDTVDKGISAAKSYKELHDRPAYDIVFIGLYENNEEEVIKTALELRGLSMNSNDLVITFIVFQNNEENELAEKLIEKIGGTTSILCTPITWKKLINQFVLMEKNKNDKSPYTYTNILKRIADYERDTNQNICEDIIGRESKSRTRNITRNKCVLCVVCFVFFY